MEIIFYVTPEQACVAHQTDAPVIAIKAWGRGFYPIYSRLTADELNGGRNGRHFTNEEREAAVIGSMVGWNVPGAKAAADAALAIEKAEAQQAA